MNNVVIPEDVLLFLTTLFNVNSTNKQQDDLDLEDERVYEGVYSFLSPKQCKILAVYMYQILY